MRHLGAPDAPVLRVSSGMRWLYRMARRLFIIPHGITPSADNGASVKFVSAATPRPQSTGA